MANARIRSIEFENKAFSDSNEAEQGQPNILNTLKLAQALKLAKKKLKEGSSEEARRIYKDILARFPKNKKATEGIKYTKFKLNFKPSSNSLEREKEAKRSYNKGNVKYRAGDLDGAKQAFMKAIHLKFDFAEAHNSMGLSLQCQGDLEGAIESYKTAIKIIPHYGDAFYNIGNAMKDKGDQNGAIKSYKRAININPHDVEAYNSMGDVLQHQGKLEEALKAYKSALSIKPDYADPYNNMGNALKEQGKLEEAIVAYNKAIAIKPHYAEVYNNMGNALKDQGKPEGALKALNKAISIQPEYAEAHLNRSFVLLNKGSLNQGLEEYEWRWRTAEQSTNVRRFSKPIWNGVDCLKSRDILIWGEQGPQDMIIWSSCLKYLIPLTKHCILECPEKLVSLFARSFPNVEVRPENRNLDIGRNDFDFHLPMGSLFRHFIPEISKQKVTDTFLIPDPVRIEFWKKRLKSLGNGPFVGISWKSPAINSHRAPNYTKITDWSPIFDLRHAIFINLQSTEFSDDLAEIQDSFKIKVHNFDDLDHFNNLDEVAALSAALDIAVSVSTAVSAITAGVGTTTKLVAWRQSPWNNILLSPRGPTLEAFERNTWEPWDKVFQSIADKIEDF